MTPTSRRPVVALLLVLLAGAATGLASRSGVSAPPVREGVGAPPVRTSDGGPPSHTGPGGAPGASAPSRAPDRASAGVPPARSAVPAAPAPASVLLVTIDTLRPDALGWIGGGDASPAMDALAAGGFRFPAAVSPVPVTLPAHAALMTGTLPRRLGVRDNGQILGSGPPTLAQLLGGRGYATAAFVSGFPLAASFGLDRGFRHYDDRLTEGAAWRLERRADATTRAALEWLATAPSTFFLWVHYYDPHDPYDPPQGFRRPGPRGAYEGEVAFTDRQLGTLLEAARKRTGGSLLTVLTADHGESFGEHGEETHGFFLYQSTVAVPLVFHLPGRLAPGESRRPARLVDVAPTVLDLLDLPPLSGVDGRSLRPLFEGRGEELEAVTAYLESQRPWRSYGWAPLRAVRQGPWKLIAAPRPELYHLERDPGETANLVDEERAVARRLQEALLAVEQRPPAQAAIDADPETAAKLAALGYGGTGSPRGEAPAGLPDPKDRVETWHRLDEAELLLQRRRFAEALAVFERVLAEEPGNRFALSRSGIALLELGRAADAAARLRSAIEIDPRHTPSQQALAVALGKLGRQLEAAEVWAQVTRLAPRNPQSWASLAAALEAAGQRDRALTALEQAVELAPQQPALRIRRALLRRAAGDLAGAVAELETAAALSPENAFPRAGGLGLLLLELGRETEARTWLARSRPEEGNDFGLARLALARLQAREGDAEAARRALGEALAAAPRLRPRAQADPALAPLLN